MGIKAATGKTNTLYALKTHDLVLLYMADSAIGYPKG